MLALPPAGWFADPCGRYEYRYWDGSQWTHHVASQGRPEVDPPVDWRPEHRSASRQSVPSCRSKAWRVGNWVWRTMTHDGRAWQAYERGDQEFEVTLSIDDSRYVQTLREIEAHGWRRVKRVDHPSVRKTDVTPRPDGTHEVVRTKTQNATFHFVRSE